MLTAEQIKKFQVLYEQRFGTAISEVEALEMGLKLISLVRLAASTEATTHKERNERTNHDTLNPEAQV